jgi:hypothetical protein
MRDRSSWPHECWSSIEVAPQGEDVLLLVSDGIGEPYALRHPFKLNDNLWVHSKKGTALKVQPLKWRFKHERTKKMRSVGSDA